MFFKRIRLFPNTENSKKRLSKLGMILILLLYASIKLIGKH